MKNDQKPSAIKRKLLHQLQLARIKAEAMDFVIYARDDLSKVRDVIRTRNEKMAVSENYMIRSGDPLSEEINRVYIQGLQEGLDLVQEELQKTGSYTEQLSGRLHKIAVPFDAIGDAIQFVLDTSFNIVFISKEIAETEDFLLHPPESLINAQNPESTPGIYKRHYLKTLKEIARLLSR
jgi:hypothetical protein